MHFENPGARGGRGILAALFIALCAVVQGCCDEDALPRAIDQLSSPKASERNQALHVVGRCGQRSESAVPTIERLMYDQNVGVASSAAYALRRIDTHSARQALKAAEARKHAKRP